MKKFAFFDLDDTLYNGSSPIDFHYFLVAEGICPDSLKADTDGAIQRYLAKEKSYAETVDFMLSLTAQHLKGHSVEEIKAVCQKFLESHHKLFDFVFKLIPLLKGNEFTCIIVSAASLPVVSVLNSALGMDKVFATEFEVVDGVYTGVVLRIMDGAEKKRMIEALLAGPEADFSLGFGDSTGDIDMLSATSHSFVISPKQEEMRSHAHKEGWTVTTPEDVLSQVKEVLHLAK